MKLGKIYGIKIKLNLSTLVIVGLVGYYAASLYVSLTGDFNIATLITLGIINGVIMLFSILAHELMHSIFAQKYGLNVTEIELYLFGGVSKIEEEPRTPRSELLIAAIGPLTSLLIGGILFGLTFIPISYPASVYITLFYAGVSNIGLGIFNFLPAFPVDGGRVLRAFLWYRRKDVISATKTASRIGVFFGYGLVAIGFLQSFFLGLFNGFWLIIIGFFLVNSAKNSYIQLLYSESLSKYEARDLSDVPSSVIPFNTLISEAIRNYFMRYRKDFFPVSRGGEIIGIVSLSDIQRIEPKKRNHHIIGYITQSVDNFPSIMEHEKGDKALIKLNQRRMNPNIVIVRDGLDEDRIIGFITQEDVQSALKFRQLTVES